MTITLSPLAENDKRLLFDWANDIEVRKNSFNSTQILWSDHEKWFKARIDSNSTRIYVARNEDQQAVGQIRFEKIHNYALINFSVDKAFRGRGLGTVLLEQGCSAIFQAWEDISFVVGYVKRENEPSRAAFIKASFESVETEDDFLIFKRYRR